MSRARVGMRGVVISVTVAIVAAAVLAVGIAAERNTRRALTREAEARLLLESRNLALTASGALLSDLPELTLQPVVRELCESRAELAFAVVLDHRGFVQGHRDVRELGRPWQAPAHLASGPTEARLRPGESLTGNRDILVATVPVMSAAGQRLGTASVALRRGYVERAVAAARREQLVLVGLVLAAGIALAFGVLTLLLRPIGALRAGLERIGRGDLDTPIGITDRTELGLLADTVDAMAGQLKVAQREVLEKERLAHEVELARDLQQRLLPSRPHTSGPFMLRGTHRAAAEVGGDAFDVLPMADGRVAVAIADVAGKGLGGCLVMAMLSATTRALRESYRSPSALLVALEEQLLATLRPGEFVTMFYGLLDPKAGTLTWASAGHVPPLIWRAADGAAEWHRTRGIPLGAVRGGVLRGTLEDRVTVLAPGDRLFQFTDGMLEAHDPHGEQFGFERIATIVRERAGEGPDAVLDALHAAVSRWTGDAMPEDDQTLLVLARDPEAADAAPPAAGPPRDALAALAAARAHGHGLELPARADALDRLGPWLARLDGLAALPDATRLIVEVALHELCANAIEHGQAQEPLELAWVPGAGAGRAGWFLLRDRGLPFHPARRQPWDAAHHPAWGLGRGLGLELVHRILANVVFRPGTPEGNVTMMSFDPVRALAPKEQRHG